MTPHDQIEPTIDPMIGAELLERYLGGACEREEYAQVERWLDAVPERRDRLAALRKRLEPGVSDAVARGTTDTLWEQFVTRWSRRDALHPERNAAVEIAGTSVPSRTPAAGRPPRTGGGWIRSTRGGVYAAGILAVVLLMFAMARGGARTDTGVTRTYSTQTGQMARLTLDDSTRVVLGPRTMMRLTRFGANSRTVDIDGLASFTVARSSGTPFIVRAGGTTARVLGTQFIVQQYRTDARFHVAVVDGKVALMTGISDRTSPVVLTAGNVGDVSDSLVVVRKVDNIQTETGWLHDDLAFDDASVAEVLAALTRWYGYEFHLADSSMTRQHVRIALNTHSSSSALAALKQVLNVDLTFSGHTITLTPRGDRSATPKARRATYDVWTPSKEVGR